MGAFVHELLATFVVDDTTHCIGEGTLFRVAWCV
jgi:hypothetical protein